MNIVTGRSAGERRVEYFRIGADDGAAARHAAASISPRDEVLALPPAVERRARSTRSRRPRPHASLRAARTRETRRARLAKAARDPLGIGTRQRASGRCSPVEGGAVRPFGADPSAAWAFLRDLLDADLDTPAFTLEKGMWRTVVTHQTPFERRARSRTMPATAAGPLRFGDGAFGRPPRDGHDPRVALLAPSPARPPTCRRSLSHLDPPPGAPPGNRFAYAAARHQSAAVRQRRRRGEPGRHPDKRARSLSRAAAAGGSPRRLQRDRRAARLGAAGQRGHGVDRKLVDRFRRGRSAERRRATKATSGPQLEAWSTASASPLATRRRRRSGLSRHRYRGRGLRRRRRLCRARSSRAIINALSPARLLRCPTISASAAAPPLRARSGGPGRARRATASSRSGSACAGGGEWEPFTGPELAVAPRPDHPPAERSAVPGDEGRSASTGHGGAA